MNILRTLGRGLRDWWKRQRTLAKFGMIAGVFVLAMIALGGGKKDNRVIETVVRQNLVRTVSATGTVVSTTDLSLSFQESNLVRSINVAVGDKVSKGQILATLANASESAAVQSARGTLLAAQARYNKVIEGEGNEEIRKAEIEVENAKRKLFSDDLVAEIVSNNIDDEVPVITGVYNGATEGEYRVEFGNSLSQIKYSGLESGTMLISDFSQALGSRGLYVDFPESGYSINSEWVIKIPNVSGENYAVNYNAYKAALAQLDIKKASARSADVDAARAEVVSAQGSLASAQAAFEKTVIRAPSGGTVTKVDLKLGQLAETFVPVITLQDVGNLYIEANVNESNISNIAIDQPVTVTYDAFGKDAVTETTISSVDLGATVVDNIVNYEVKAIVPDATNIRPGMTANLSIQTAFAPDVLVIPERVISSKDGRQTVEVLIDERRGTTSTRAVTTGLRGDGGLIEITSGLSEGERVVFNPN